VQGYSKTYKDGKTLRSEEILESYSTVNSFQDKIVISQRKFVQLQAILNICRVVFVFFLFFIRLYFFNHEAKSQIINPL
jgi:hypothetical protein